MISSGVASKSLLCSVLDGMHFTVLNWLVLALAMGSQGSEASLGSALKWQLGRRALALRRGKVVPATVEVSVRFRRPPTEDELRNFEDMGVRFFRWRGKVLHVGRIYGADVPWAVLEDLARHPLVERLEAARRVKVVPLLDVSGAQVGAREAWDMGGWPGSLTGKGVRIALFDTGVDLHHPAFWRAGEPVSWVDSDGDGVLTPGVDGIDLDGDGRLTSDEVLRLWKAEVRDPYGRYKVEENFDPYTDWLYLDENGNGRRDSGFRSSGGVLILGEPAFVPEDEDGDGVLEAGEPLRPLNTLKVVASLEGLEGWPVEREGPQLADDPGDPDNHGTPAAGIILGGFPGRRWVGIAPGAELLVVHREGLVPEQFVPWAVEMGADVMVYEFGGWVFEFLDGSSNLERTIDELARKGIVQLTAAGNLAGPTRKKHCRLRIEEEGRTVRVNVPEEYGIRTIYLTFLWRSPEGLDVEVIAPGGLRFRMVPDGEVREVLGLETFGNVETSPRGTHKFDVALNGEEGLEIGVWSFVLKSEGTPFVVEGYLADDVSDWKGGAQFLDFVTDEGTVAWPGTADEAITVAAYDPSGLRNPKGEINDFSGRGPRIDGRRVVDIAAPGSVVFSTWTKEASGSPGCYGPFEGTSSALPHVAGAAAILLQACPYLGHEGVKEALCKGARSDEHTGKVPNDTWGWGKLHIPGALRAAGFSGNLPPLVHDVRAGWREEGWRVEAEVEDPDGISSVWLYFESRGNSGKVPMAWKGGGIYGAEVDVTDTIWCYIKMLDGRGAEGFWPAGAPLRRRMFPPPAIREVGRMGGFCKMSFPGDVDGDLLPDLFACGSLYLNTGGWNLERIQQVSSPLSACWGDYDGDGDPDLYVSGSLYRNEGGRLFKLIGLPGGRGAWVDYDGDGDLDLCVVRGLRVLLYRNLGDGKFEEAEHIGVGSPINDISWGDYDGDGDFDLCVARLGHVDLYRNADGGFEEVSREVGVDVRTCQHVTWVDYDGDGDLDLYIMRPAPNLLYRNRDGTFQEVASEVGVNIPGCAMWMDYDLDGDLDLLGISSRELLRNDGGKFRRVWRSEEPLHGASYADWDGDAVPEIILVGRRPPGHIYRSPLHGNCVALRIWKASGAKVRLTSGDNLQVRQIVADDGLPLYFGLGEADGAEVEVTWPDGRTLTWGCLRSGRAYILGPEGPLDTFVWPGDVDGDGEVGGGDIEALAEYWGLSGPQRPHPSPAWAGQPARFWDPEEATYADADGDGKVDKEDLRLVLKNWGRAFGEPAPRLERREVISEAYRVASKVHNPEVRGKMLSVLRPEMAELGIPSELGLHALPNPFRDGTTFRLRLPFGGRGFLRLYNVLGRPVRTLWKGTWRPGEIFLSWDGRDEGGRKVASGVYIARLEVGGEARATKVLLVR